MLAIFLRSLHIAPLTFIVCIVIVAVIQDKIIKKVRVSSEIIMAFLLILASLGLGAGHFIHKSGFEHIELFDPCYGYVMTLVGIAYKLFKAKLTAKIL